MPQEQRNLLQRWLDYRISKTVFFLSCIACASLTAGLGFTLGHWVTGQHAALMAEKASTKASTDLAASICVNRFLRDKDAAAHLTSLKNTEFWIRGQEIDKGGWDVLPGQKTAADGVADECAQRLAEMKPPSDAQASGAQASDTQASTDAATTDKNAPVRVQ